MIAKSAFCQLPAKKKNCQSKQAWLWKEFCGNVLASSGWIFLSSLFAGQNVWILRPLPLYLVLRIPSCCGVGCLGFRRMCKADTSLWFSILYLLGQYGLHKICLKPCLKSCENPGSACYAYSWTPNSVSSQEQDRQEALCLVVKQILCKEKISESIHSSFKNQLTLP